MKFLPVLYTQPHVHLNILTYLNPTLQCLHPHKLKSLCSRRIKRRGYSWAHQKTNPFWGSQDTQHIHSVHLTTKHPCLTHCWGMSRVTPQFDQNFVKNDSLCFKNISNEIKFTKFKSPTRPYHLEFNSEPPRINVANYCKLHTTKQEDLIKELVHKKILIACDSKKLRCIANSFFVGEGKKTRLITDFKCLNPFLKLKLPKHRMDARSIAVRLSKHGFRSNLDLSRAFYSIPIATEDRVYLGTVINGTFYMYGSLPMGMGVSPAVLQERIQEILPEKSGNCDIYTYVDDVGIHGTKKYEHDRCVKATAQGLQVGGFNVNLAKSNTTGKFCKFANFSITDAGISIQDAVLQDMQVLLELLVTKGTNTKAEYASVKGKLTWNALMLPPLATNVIDSLQHHLNNRDSWNTSIPIRKDTRVLIHHLLVKLANYTQFKASLPTSQNILLVVDSSSTHWGGFFFPGGGKPMLQLRGAHGKNVPAAANVKELEAVLRGLQHIKDMVEPGTAFQVMSDSIHVVHSLREVTERKTWKAAYVTRWKEIRELEKLHDLRINYLFCPGEANSADGLSRPELAQQDAETKARLDWQRRNVKTNDCYM
eukprot:GHVR01107628.1.p1 GENE.GHVR01107628.1~~GHVR01107628.1.p1  ORF type:complete len:594 (+),score=23.02 GHVR01107628.1:1730-3511(+)